MRVEHVGVWAADLERLREFYAAYLGATAGAKYTNPAKGFESYFLTLPGGGARLELMRVPGLAGAASGRRVGLAHVAIALGSGAEETVPPFHSPPTSKDVPATTGTPTAKDSRGRMRTVPTVVYPSGAWGCGTPTFRGKSLASGGKMPVLTALANAWKTFSVCRQTTRLTPMTPPWFPSRRSHNHVSSAGQRHPA